MLAFEMYIWNLVTTHEQANGEDIVSMRNLLLFVSF